MSFDPASKTERFCLQRRNLCGATETLSGWGFQNETDPLTDVLLGSSAHLQHLSTSSLSRKHLRQEPCNIQVGQTQHAEMVSAYEHFDVRVHMHSPSVELPMQVYARDSSVMTPYGAIITAMVPMIASQTGRWNFSINPTRVSAANSAMTPWAKLNIPEALKMSTKPSATSAYSTPVISPFSATSMA